MIPNNELKIHVVNVNHGDATIIEMPDLGTQARFGVVDFGARVGADRGLARDYMQALVAHRQDGDADLDYRIEFACVTHPHNDHYGGLARFMAVFANRIEQFWDCGFRTNSTEYNGILVNDVLANPGITFVRLGSGSEFEYGPTGPLRITVLAPSVDMRNRFDTYGVGKNDASIVLRVKFGNSYAILGADAEFAAWAKITDEFPRREGISFYDDALGLAERDDTADQLRCNLLKLAHHGSKHGTSLEYLERLEPRNIVIPAGNQAWYQANLSNWAGMFPHPLTETILGVLDQAGGNIDIRVTGETANGGGNLIYKYDGDWSPRAVTRVAERADGAGFQAALVAAWNG